MYERFRPLLWIGESKNHFEHAICFCINLYGPLVHLSHDMSTLNVRTFSRHSTCVGGDGQNPQPLPKNLTTGKLSSQIFQKLCCINI